jgi:hypothetical protein
MIKTLFSASAIVLTLGAPALAQPAPAPIVAAKPLELQLTVKAGTSTRTHQLVISEDSCGRVQEKTRDFEDEIHVCSIVKRDGARLEANWKVREKMTEYHVSWTSVVARGGTVEVGRQGDVRFTLAVK